VSTKMKRTVTIGPFSAFFSNVNTAMRLPGHSHFATVTLHYETLGDIGFPAFESTYAAVQARLRDLTELPFRDKTNEQVADALWDGLVNWTHAEIDKWQAQFALRKLELAVRGVPDKIGHADGFTVYAVERITD
jgi:hypothetical protein